MNAVDRFGELLVTRVRDEAIADWDMILAGAMKDAASRRVASAMESAGPGAKDLLRDAIPRIVDTTLHHLLWMLEQDQESIEVRVDGGDGKFVNVVDQSDGLAGDLYDWLPRFSKHRFHNPADE